MWLPYRVESETWAQPVYSSQVYTWQVLSPVAKPSPTIPLPRHWHRTSGLIVCASGSTIQMACALQTLHLATAIHLLLSLALLTPRHLHSKEPPNRLVKYYIGHALSLINEATSSFRVKKIFRPEIFSVTETWSINTGCTFDFLRPNTSLEFRCVDWTFVYIFTHVDVAFSTSWFKSRFAFTTSKGSCEL